MTVFEFLSSSKENMANFVCDRAVIPPCDLVCCNTPCNVCLSNENVSKRAPKK